MVSTPATLLGFAGVIFLAGGFAPVSFNMVSGALSQSLSKSSAPALQMQSGVRGDRVAEPLPSHARATVSTVELIGVSEAVVILRDRNGEILYRSDPQSGTTVYAKGTELPIVTLKEETRGPAMQHPVTQREGTEMQQDQKPKPRNPVGCMGDVSPLAKASANRMPSLCLASLE